MSSSLVKPRYYQRFYKNKRYIIRLCLSFIQLNCNSKVICGMKISQSNPTMRRAWGKFHTPTGPNSMATSFCETEITIMIHQFPYL